MNEEIVALFGRCQCGRNSYFVIFPRRDVHQAKVIIRPDANSAINQVLRVPISWYSSSEHALEPGEIQHSFRRTYIPPDKPNTMRHFCGFCGEALAYWSEDLPGEADYIQITIGTLSPVYMSTLAELGLVTTRGDHCFDNVGLIPEPEIPFGESKDENWWLEDGMRCSHGVVTSQCGTSDSSETEWEVTQYGGDINDIVNMVPKKTNLMKMLLLSESKPIDRSPNKRKWGDLIAG